MQINPDDYNYKALPVGDSRKFPHVGCSNSLAMKVTVDVKGCLFHCFKCNETHFVPSEGTSWRDRHQREAEKAAFLKEKAQGGYKLPADFSHSISNAGLAWLGSGGWTSAMIEDYGIGWSENLARVVIPLQPEGYIARAVFDDQKPKYLSKAPDHSHWRSHDFVSGSLVVAEDVLSAGRIGKICGAEALLGTPKKWIPPTGVERLIIWTDDDPAGRKARAHIQKTCAWMSITVSHVVTKQDPKQLDDREIRRELGFLFK